MQENITLFNALFEVVRETKDKKTSMLVPPSSPVRSGLSKLREAINQFSMMILPEIKNEWDVIHETRLFQNEIENLLHGLTSLQTTADVRDSRLRIKKAYLLVEKEDNKIKTFEYAFNFEVFGMDTEENDKYPYFSISNTKRTDIVESMQLVSIHDFLVSKIPPEV